jgi:hypothetical protein
MPCWELARIRRTAGSDAVLLIDTRSFAAQERGRTADVVAHLAEVETRRLHVRLGYDCMKTYAARELGLKDHEAYRRIEAARRGREHPVIFEALDDGRLHLTAVVLLAPHLAQGDADALLVDCFGKSKPEIESVLAERFPQADVPTFLVPTPTPNAEASQVVAPTQPHRPAFSAARVTPLAPQRFALQVTIQQDAHDLLRRAQDLLAHALPSRDMDRVLNRSCRAHNQHEAEQVFGAAFMQGKRAGTRATDEPYPPARDR